MLFLFLLLTLVTTTLSQMDAMRPDVRFGEDNDRFDVSNIVQTQNQMFRQQMEDVEEGDDDIEMERRNKQMESHRRHKHKKLPDDASLKASGRRNAFLLQEDLDNYRADDGSESDTFWFGKAKLFDRRFLNRRSGDKSQQLLSYAVPIHVKIQGFLQAPSDKQ
ncbi:uncharacterized protein LOC113227750 [Hyposmocoma kahamanoa]|uniref:uncharacterized protein LOC113227750 n=1 Tax=Hyposmocoma kahamanoa TaxID=1477025 RepID=UPI000E6D7284|nr:uncharacterized protein LOC113227750 [Hyposmocoma kahamanoa]